MEVSDERTEPRQEGFLDVFLPPMDHPLNLALVRDPRVWLVFSFLMIGVVPLFIFLDAVMQLVEQAGLFNTDRPDGSVRWGLWASLMFVWGWYVVGGASGIMCVMARRRLLTPSWGGVVMMMLVSGMMLASGVGMAFVMVLAVV